MPEITTRISRDFMTLARLALSGRQQDVFAFLQKTARAYRHPAPDVTQELIALLRETPSRASPLRDSAVPVPVDIDSRLQLVRVEQPDSLEIEPILNPTIEKVLNQIVDEHANLDQLLQAGLSPSRSVLFVGPPGVGKTLSGRWVASRLHKPLLILDLSAVMSSFLGRTGSNVRAVLDYAKSGNCVLLLDEFDAVAKRRDDSTEIGELKRLVTVLLQEIDDWPSGSLLLAATNHPDLLDPAIWRRFDITVEFPQPGANELERAIRAFFVQDELVTQQWLPVLLILFRNMSLSDVQKLVFRMRRQAIIGRTSVADELQTAVKTHARGLSHKDRLDLAQALQTVPHLSQHKINDLTGVSRVTLRKRSKASSSERRGENRNGRHTQLPSGKG